MRCSHCNVDGMVYQQRNASGSIVVVERCPKCKRNTVPGKPFLNKADYDVNTLPLFVDYAKDAPHCEVEGCTNIGSELHHYAPTHLFADSDKWAKQNLCKEHHTLWHRLTKTGPFAPRQPKEKPAWQRPH